MHITTARVRSVFAVLLFLAASIGVLADDNQTPSEIQLGCQFLEDGWQKNRPHVPIPFYCQIISDPDPFPSTPDPPVESNSHVSSFDSSEPEEDREARLILTVMRVFRTAARIIGPN